MQAPKHATKLQCAIRTALVRVLAAVSLLVGSAPACMAGPVPSAPWSEGTTPPVTLETVDLFLKLTPRVRAIEEQQMETIDEIYRSHMYHRKRRVEVRLDVLEERLEATTGVSVVDFARLRSQILDVHKTLFTIRELQEERVNLLRVWKLQLEHDTAPDELFVARRMHIDDHIADLTRIYESFPDSARGAVEARYKRILLTFKRPKKLSRAERRERRERANELLPQPPANPYREGFFDEW